MIGVLIVAILFLRYVLYPIRVVFPPLVVAMIIVYLLNPIVRRLEPRVGRLWGAVITYLVFLSIMAVSLRFLIPAMADQVGSFAESVPDLLARLQNSVNNLADRFDLNFYAQRHREALGPDRRGRGVHRADLLVHGRGAPRAVVAVLGPILAFYLLVDLPKIQRGIKALIPTRRRAEVESVLEKMGKALGGFFRGQLMVALFVGLASILALWIVGLPYFALVGLICGLFNLIPLVGPFIAAVPALFIAFTTTTSGGLLSLEPGLPLALGAVIALLVVQQIDNHIVSPNVVARTVKLHPVTVMLGLLVGGTLLGLWGMLLAVPLIAAVKILLLHYWDTRMQWPPAPAEPPADLDKTDPAGDGIPVEPANGSASSCERSASPRRPGARAPGRRSPELQVAERLEVALDLGLLGGLDGPAGLGRRSAAEDQRGAQGAHAFRMGRGDVQALLGIRVQVVQGLVLPDPQELEPAVDGAFHRRVQPLPRRRGHPTGRGELLALRGVTEAGVVGRGDPRPRPVRPGMLGHADGLGDQRGEPGQADRGRSPVVEEGRGSGRDQRDVQQSLRQ